MFNGYWHKVPGALSLGVKRPEHEADHSLPSSAEVSMSSWRGAYLNRDNFTFHLYYY